MDDSPGDVEFYSLLDRTTLCFFSTLYWLLNIKTDTLVQACQGDLCVGLYLWAHHTLPLVGGKSGSNPQTRDLILQVVERSVTFDCTCCLHFCLLCPTVRANSFIFKCNFRILSAPKARTILVNGAVRKGERLMSPSSLDLLLRVTFPAPSARVKVWLSILVVFFSYS